jgi:hypothetical protein
MQLKRFVRKLGLLGMLGLTGFAGGCGPGSSDPLSPAESKKVQASHKGTHEQLQQDAKDFKAKVQRQGLGRRGGHGGPRP